MLLRPSIRFRERSSTATGKSEHLWQARPFSCVLDEAHTWAAIRYVERNPVRAQMIERAEDYAWSSAAAHCGLVSNPLLFDLPSDGIVDDWSKWLAGESDCDRERAIREGTFTGRPCGAEDFVKGMEALLGRSLLPAKRGRKPLAR